MSEVFTHEIRVRYGECDQQNVVFNANWLGYFDVLMTELWRARLGGYTGMLNEGADMMVVEVTLRLRGPARFDDVIEFTVSVARLGATALTSHIEAHVDGRLVADGEIRHVFVEPGTHEKCPIPDRVRAALEPLVAA
jgi:acyl-CoA thioester hydrolase